MPGRRGRAEEIAKGRRKLEIEVPGLGSVREGIAVEGLLVFLGFGVEIVSVLGDDRGRGGLAGKVAEVRDVLVDVHRHGAVHVDQFAVGCAGEAGDAGGDQVPVIVFVVLVAGHQDENREKNGREKEKDMFHNQLVFEGLAYNFEQISGRKTKRKRYLAVRKKVPNFARFF